jgi:hypothetical protein
LAQELPRTATQKPQDQAAVSPPAPVLRLVHDRAFSPRSDDLAVALLFSAAGLIVHFTVLASGGF